MSFLNQINQLSSEKQKVFFYHARKILKFIQEGSIDLIVKPYNRLFRQQQIKRKIISKKDEIESASAKSELYSKNIYEILEDGYDYASEIKSLGDRDQSVEIESLKIENRRLKEKRLWGEMTGDKQNFSHILREHLLELKKQNTNVGSVVKKEMSVFSDFLSDAKDKLMEVKKKLKKSPHIYDFKDEELIDSIKMELNRRYNMKVDDIKPLKSMMFQTLFLIHSRIQGYDMDEHIKQILTICMIENKDWSDGDSEEEQENE